MIQTVLNYLDYVKNLPNLLRATHYKASYFLEKLNMPRPTYYRKLKENTFTIKEVMLITNLLFPEEAYLIEIKEELSKGREDIKEGRVHNHEDVMKEVINKYKLLS